MSELELIEVEKLLSKKDIKNLKRRARRRAQQLKTLRTFYDRLARKHFKKYIENGRSWKGLEADKKLFRDLMSKRHKLHERIARLVPEKVEPEWDSP